MDAESTDPWKNALSYFHKTLRQRIEEFEGTFLRVATLQTTLETELAQLRNDHINVNENLQKWKGVLNGINLKIQEWKNLGPNIALRKGDVNAITQSMRFAPFQIVSFNANLATIETEQRSLWTQYEAHKQWEQQQQQQQQQRQQRQKQRQQQEDSERIVKRNDDDDDDMEGGSRRRRRRRSLPKSSRKYKKSAKRVFRKKSRSTRRH